ncbi:MULTISPECIES: large conductance mechanosensitive channel protein MscL [Corynebacterium]|uniref:Large-conductance mechanosensitive channel n=1 Tax=Corynebacterium coyleae TaxID=53374 RepID=A0AAP6XKK1_9CORY|nr:MULTISPECIES: large conductance mechanosensitive channel protein MscL [Corynebacterium]MDK6493927.1 large conductance mechanosensitive channel protein MscL [Corynebacterium coyleae]MDK8242205.1 large conductance mechanosensitive channel protein MscL [Corynebacterium coyleae]MDK8663607.1 large conductance mechanosensitive channel protein MscL [Corynebacterium coyleae]MDK8706557.1 large conductance mechanosensitive channel protein MscL [Corynebacterium coyleae]MDK8733409.1 large conductance m
MLQGFKDFIMRGNVIDLAVGVVIGAAFTAVVTAFSDSIINPFLAALGGVDYSGLGFFVREGNEATFVDFGALITAIINFLLIAAVIYFLLVMPMNKLDEAQKRHKGVDPEEPAPTETELLAEIRDLLSNQNPNSTQKPLN